MNTAAAAHATHSSAPSTADILGAPIRIGPLELANRLVIAPHTVNFGIAQGRVDDSFVAYMARRAGGFAATIIALAAPHPSGRAEPSQPWLWDDRFIPDLATLATALRDAGTEPALQLNHAGRQTNRQLLDGEQPVAPSAVPARSIYREPPRPLTTGEIGDLVESFASAAGRALRAGYRIVNLHFAHGYLVSQFLSADANRRDDAYGGPLENRMRFGLEIVRAIRDTVGTDAAIDVRINGADFVEGGIEIDDAVTFARALVAAGANSLNVSGGVYGSDPFNLLLPFDGHEFLPLAAAVRGAVDVPVTGVGNVRFPDEAARAIASGLCDLVGVARPVMADPDWALKALGRAEAPVRPCLGTVDGCSKRLSHFEPAACQVMPELGREARPVPAAAARRRVVVVGGGPAGCEAATYAASRGHDVVLVEQQERLGGALVLAGAAPGGAPFRWLASYFAEELERLGVEVRLGRPATAETVTGLGPEHVIVATGAVPEVPDIPGIDVGTVLPDDEVLADPTAAPTRPLVLGAGRRAVATALALAERGGRVTLVDHRRSGVARDASALMRRAYNRELALRGIETVPGRVREITSAGVELADGSTLTGDAVVVSLGQRSQRAALDGVRVLTTVVGDAKAPRAIMDAIAEARDAVEAIA